VNIRNIAAAAAVVGCISAPGLAAAGTITIQQYFSAAPNAFGSPSFDAWQANAINSLRNGLGNIGDPTTDPTAYVQLNGTYNPGDAMVTSFPAWQGTADPTGAFASELGNRIHAGVVIVSETPFDLQSVSFKFNSTDNALLYEGDLSGTSFGARRVGISYGGDGALGGGDDVVYDLGNPGTDSTLINELYYVGVGNAYWPGGADPSPSNPLLGRQGALDDTAQYIRDNLIGISNQYCVTDDAGQSSCNTASLRLAPVPEPATALTLAGSLLFLGLRRRRKA
jgi:hypothetical protein